MRFHEIIQEDQRRNSDPNDVPWRALSRLTRFAQMFKVNADLREVQETPLVRQIMRLPIEDRNVMAREPLQISPALERAFANRRRLFSTNTR